MNKVAELERRVLALEEHARRMFQQEQAAHCRANELTERYGEYVDKTVAARIQGACEGRRVSVSSIEQYMMKPKLGEGGRSRRGKKRPRSEAAMQA